MQGVHMILKWLILKKKMPMKKIITMKKRKKNRMMMKTNSVEYPYLTKVPIRRSDQFNILTWWQTNSAEYPTLSRMARDILAVPASTVASELAFSTGKRVLSDFQSRLTPKTVEALVCLQDWIQATANTERSMASVHDIILELEDEEGIETSGSNGQYPSTNNETNS